MFSIAESEFLLLYTLPRIWWHLCFRLWLSNRCLVMPHCGFTLHFPGTKDTENLLMHIFVFCHFFPLLSVCSNLLPIFFVSWLFYGQFLRVFVHFVELSSTKYFCKCFPPSVWLVFSLSRAAEQEGVVWKVMVRLHFLLSYLSLGVSDFAFHN